jgi:hypothetical protein
MKTKILFLLLLLSPLAAKADLDYQLYNIQGDWDNDHVVFRIEQQGETSVRAYKCDRDEYYSNNYHCLYSKIFLLNYRADLDAFYLDQRPFAAEGWQVALQSSDDMLIVTNPYHLTSSVYGQYGVYGQNRKVR